MRLLSEGFRRVNARGEGIDYEAKQHSNLKFGTLIAGACISSFSMFTTTPALGQVEGKDFLPVTVGGQTESQMLQDFLAWALLNNTELYEKYKDSSTFDEISVEDVLIWREDTEEPVLQITEISIGEIDIEDGETFTLTIGGLIITSTEGTDFTKTGDPEIDKQLLLESLALKANQSGQLPTGYIVEVIDGKLVITGNGDGSFAVSVTSETNDTEFIVEKKQEFQRVESLLAGSFNLNASCQRFLIENRTTSANTSLTSDVSGEIEFSRTADATITILFDGGAANWAAPVFWENMDVYWDAPESASTPYLAKVYERDADASIIVNGSVGTADYGSTLFWEFVDVNWDEEDTSTGQQFFSTVHERNTSPSISMSVTVGQAGWASDFQWDALDINWDDNVAGQIHQGNATASISLNASSSSIETDLETRTASGTISLSTNVSGDIDTIFAINASSQFSLSTNLNSELIQGWNSETTLMENLNRNWEAI
jgi:hypothetical protein